MKFFFRIISISDADVETNLFITHPQERNLASSYRLRNVELMENNVYKATKKTVMRYVMCKIVCIYSVGDIRNQYFIRI